MVSTRKWYCIFLLHYITAIQACPSPLCSCGEDNVVDCHDRRLDRVPSFHIDEAKHYEKIALNSNEIDVVPPYSFRNLHCKQVDLSENPLKGISPRAFVGIETELETLDLKYTETYVIHWAVFQKLSKLRVLNLSNNVLFVIQKELFEQLHQLVELDISYNRLKRLEQWSFASLENLKTLKLQGNAISHIEALTFNNLRHLKTLNLKSNRLTNIDPVSFRGLERLVELDLSDNLLSVIPTEAFKHMSGLHVLQLDENNITRVTDSCLSGAYNLSILTLSYNQISNVTDLAFRGLTHLITLDLSSNNITGLGNHPCSFVISSLLMNLSLDSNPLDCSCNMSWIADLLAKDVSISGTCGSPKNYDGAQLQQADFSICNCEMQKDQESDVKKTLN